MQLVSTQNHSYTEVDIESRVAIIYKNILIVNVTKILRINFSLLKIKTKHYKSVKKTVFHASVNSSGNETRCVLYPVS